MISQGWTQTPPSGVPASATPVPSSAEELYKQLRTVGLSKSRVYQVREVSLDRSAVHLTLDDGTIAFTEDVAGRVTGAFFEGEGEILLIPPDRMERTSMHLFTGAAILEERFSTAYFRFNDDTYAELRPQLVPAEHTEEFLTRWSETAQNLAEVDAMRLLLSFSDSLPLSGALPQPAPTHSDPIPDRMLRARLQGQKLGIFDVFYDARSPEQVGLGQLRSVQGQSYYDVWTSFSPGSATWRSAQARKEETAPDREFSVTQFKIKAEVNPPTTLTAEATLQLEMHRGGARTLLFELSRFLEVKGVEADGRAVEFIHNQALEGTQLARRGNDVVAVIFPQPLQAGQKISLRFVYGGDVLSEAGGGLLYVGARGTWYPNRGVVMSNFDLEFHYPPGWTLIATGKRMDADAPASANPALGQAASAPAELVSHWVTERPIPVAGFNLGRYERATAHAGDVAVESYATSGVEHTFPKGSPVILPGPAQPSPLPNQAMVMPAPVPSPARNAQAVADRSAQAVDFFSRRFGPYPFHDLALTQMPGDLSQGWPGLIFLSSFSFLTAREKAQLHLRPVDTILSNLVITHETAHQWWGDLINWSSYRDQWIVEALANYSALMLLESEDPDQFRLALAKYRDDLLEKNQDDHALMEAGPVTLGTRLSSSRFPSGYEAISYGRGTWLLHMLRYMLRDAAAQKTAARGGKRAQDVDEPFVRALHTLRDRFAGKAITTEDLLHVFEEQLPPSLWYEGHKSLDWFYQGWVNGTAVPRYSLQNVKYAPKGGSTTVSGTIVQKNAPDDLVTSVPIYAAVSGKSVLLGRVFADGPETSFHLTAPTGTTKLLLDPNQTLLSRNR
jgi:hypothetical protein